MVDLTAIIILIIVSLGGMGMLYTILNSPIRKAKAEIYKKKHTTNLLEKRQIDQINARLAALESRIEIQEDRVKEIGDESQFIKRLLSDKSSEQNH